MCRPNGTKLLHLSLAATLTVLATASSAPAFDVTSCGQTVPPRTVGTLRADLVCDDALDVAVRVGRGASLRLNGHSITGAKVAVGCHGRCRISGPGEIVAPRIWGVGQLGTKSAYRAHVRVEDLTVRDAPEHGVGIQLAGGAFLLRNVTLERNAAGVCCDGVVRGEHLTIRDNREVGVEARSITLSDFTISGSPVGVFTLPYNYVRRQAPQLRRGSLTGNGVDIRSLDRPKVRDVACQHSESLDGTPWGVCSED